MIITDTIECFVEEAICSLIRSSNLPLSVIVCGVSEATSLSRLDAHLNPTMAAEMKENPTWQTVVLKKYANDEEMLSKECLRHVEDNMIRYYRRAGILPNP